MGARGPQPKPEWQRVRRNRISRSVIDPYQSSELDVNPEEWSTESKEWWYVMTHANWYNDLTEDGQHELLAIGAVLFGEHNEAQRHEARKRLRDFIPSTYEWLVESTRLHQQASSLNRGDDPFGYRARLMAKYGNHQSTD